GILLIILSIRYLKKYPLVAFPVLFFFLNHIIESTVLPLELIFEHRNYLPSLFIFLPLSVFIAHAIYAPSKFSFVGRFAIAAGTVCFLIISGQATYTRNFAWADEGTLWSDSIKKAPSSPRAAGYLGQWYQKIEQPQKAYYYFRFALQNSYLAPTPKKSQLAASQSLGLVHYESEEYKKAIPYFNQCINIEKNNRNCLTNRARSYLQLYLPQKALDDAEILVADYPTYLLAKYIAASASYRLGALAEAQRYMHEIIQQSLDKPKGLYLMGLILLKYKSYPNALFFLRQAVDQWPSNAEYQFSLAAAYYINNQLDAAEQTLRNIFNRYPLPVIETALQNFKPDAPSQESVIFAKNFLSEILREEI
ncbi:MAG: tetratricopeptide repeat protein, partial [Candidatus Electrothrix sp. LOE1_4_5]|nr:tetratricopeptide repeat protein [Candidatus Electrothrix gigas]